MIKKNRDRETYVRAARILGKQALHRPKLIDTERNIIATDRIRNRLFLRYSAEEIGIILVSEILLPFMRIESAEFSSVFGGMDYLIVHKVCHKIRLCHTGKTSFRLYAYRRSDGMLGKELVVKSFDLHFNDIDWAVFKNLQGIVR